MQGYISLVQGGFLGVWKLEVGGIEHFIGVIQNFLDLAWWKKTRASTRVGVLRWIIYPSGLPKNLVEVNIPCMVGKKKKI